MKKKVKFLNKVIAKKGEIARYVLATVGVGGIFLIGVVAPNLFKAFPYKRFNSYPKSSLDRAIERLKRKGLIRFVQGPSGWRIELTDKGREVLSMFEMRNKLLRTPRRWDGKWRFLIFDIAEKRRSIRDQIRRSLVNFGFYRLQDSVWVHPCECEEILELLRTNYGVRYDALYLRADKLAKDQPLRRHFNLE